MKINATKVCSYNFSPNYFFCKYELDLYDAIKY